MRKENITIITNPDRYEKIGDNIFWRYSEDITPFVFEFLKKEFPGKLIIHEFDNVDIMILNENLPVEIQSTRFNGKSIMMSDFEDSIRRQVDTNIKIYGRCWLFFDLSLLVHMQNGLHRTSCINMDWLYQYMKEDIIRIFTITHDGIIKETCNKDFSFLPKMSTTCKRSEDEDFRILQKNRANIASNILIGHGFTTEEINDMYETYRIINKCEDKKHDFVAWLKREGCTDRELGYHNIFKALYVLEKINKILDCEFSHKNNETYSVFFSIKIGLLERDKNKRIRFVDKYNIAQYFPGYIRNKELWDYLEKHNVDQKTFYAIIRRETDFLWWKKNQTDIADIWNNYGNGG